MKVAGGLAGVLTAEFKSAPETAGSAKDTGGVDLRALQSLVSHLSLTGMSLERARALCQIWQHAPSCAGSKEHAGALQSYNLTQRS